MNKYLYKGTIIKAFTKVEAIQRIVADSSIKFLDALSIFVQKLRPQQRNVFKKCIKEKLKEKVTRTEYSYNSDSNGTQWAMQNLAYDDGEGGIVYSAITFSFYYTFEAANRIAKKLGARLPSKQEWINLATSMGGVIVNKEDSGFKQKDNRNIIIENTDAFNEFLHIKKYTGFLDKLYSMVKEGQYAIYWTDKAVGGGAVCEYIGHKFIASNVISKDYYATVRLIK